MPDVRFGIDASGARAGFDELTRYFRGIAEEAKRTQQTLNSLSNGGAASPQALQAAQQQTRATQEQAKATNGLTQAQAAQAKASQELVRSAQAEDRARIAQIRSGLTFLRVINDEQASYARRVDASLRYARALGIEVDSQKLLIAVQNQLVRAREQSVKATSQEEIASRNLRNNMRAQSTALGALSKDFRAFAGVLNILPGQMGIVATQLAVLTRGFASLGVTGGILTVLAAGFIGLGVAADRTSQIPSLLSKIGSGLKEMAAQAGEAIRANQILVTVLEKLKGLVPTPPGSAVERRDRTRAELAGVEEKFAGFPDPVDREFRIASDRARLNARLIREEALATLELVETRKKLLTSISQEEQIRQVATEKRIQASLAAKAGAISEAELADAKARINDEERKGIEALAKKTEAYKETNQAIKEAQERTEAYNEALGRLRAEEDQATINQAQRLEEMKLNNDLLVKEIAATKEGTEALKAFNIEKAKSLEIQRQRESGANLSAETSEALVTEAVRTQRLQDQLKDQTTLAKEVTTVWGNAIDNIQRGFGDLFTNLILDGKDAFDQIGDTLKSMFARVIGELVNANVFEPLFNLLRVGTSGVGGANVQQRSGSALGQLRDVDTIGTSIGKSIAKVLGSSTGPTSPTGTQIISFSSGSFQRGTGFTLQNPNASQPGGGIGGALGEAVGIGAGIFAGAQLSQQFLESVLETQGERIAARVGEVVGGIIGGIVGSIFGVGALGGLVGSFVGGGVLGGFVQAFNVIGSGKSILEGSHQQVGTRTAALTGDPLLTLIFLLLRDKHDTQIAIATGRTEEEVRARGLQGNPANNVVTSPFGVLGALGSLTGGDINDQGIRGALKTIAAVDTALSLLLGAAESERIRQLGLPDFGVSSPKGQAGKLTGQRIPAVLRAIGFPEETLSAFPSTKDTTTQIEEAARLIGLRKELNSLVDALNGVVEVAPNAKKSLSDLEIALARIAAEGPSVGIVIADIEALRVTALATLRSQFNKGIADQILELINPGELALAQLVEENQRRLEEVTEIGGDIVQVERLNMLKRIDLLERINAPIQSLVDQLKFSPAGSSPLTALSAAETRFFDVRSGLLTGTGGFSRDDLAASAQTFLNLGEQFLGGPAFSASRDLVLSTLESMLLTLPGTSSDTGEQLGSIAMETARGNTANEQLLGQLLNENALIRAELVLLRSDLARLLAA